MVVEDRLAPLVQQGDREAFGQLVRRFGPEARRICRAILRHPEDADDAAQDGFLAALSRIETYDPVRPFGPWLMKIVANAARDLARRRKVRMVESLPDDAASTAPGPENSTFVATLGEALEQALAELPERQRLAVVLYEVEGYAHREIAEILDLPQGTVRSEVHHARRRLREIMSNWREESS